MNHMELEPAGTQSSLQDKSHYAAILEHLTRIRSSHAFGNSERAKQFLSYVVEHAVDGHTELLKERSIGVDLFNRSPSYITGEDSIVRVQAADVRRRLLQYYSEEEQTPEVQIEIPVGSYVPRFHWKTSTDAEPRPDKAPGREQNGLRPKLRVWAIAAATIVLVVFGIALASTIQGRSKPRSALEDFWAPALKTGEPVLICLPSPVASAFVLNLGTEPRADYLVNKDNAYVATDLTELFARTHKSSQVRIGRDFTYDDLRNSPAILIGAYDNPWTMRMISDLPIVFREEGRQHWIEERSSNRIWRPTPDGGSTTDFAIVARLVNSKTGQFLVILGGLGMVGTQATGKFVSNQDELGAALRTAPAGWQGKNIEMVIEADVIDGSASPPRVLAVKTW